MPKTSIKISDRDWRFLLPICSVLFIILAAISAVLISKYRGDINEFLPFISYAAGHPPQCGIFAILAFMSAMAGVATIALRYYVFMKFETWKTINLFLLICGLAFIFGNLLIAAFPVFATPKQAHQDKDLAVALPHQIGTIIAFVCSLLYCAGQTFISCYHQEDIVVSFCGYSYQKIYKPVAILRCLLLFISLVAAMFMALLVLKGEKVLCVTDENGEDREICNVKCSGAEWIFFMTTCINFLSFFLEILPRSTTSETPEKQE